MATAAAFDRTTALFRDFKPNIGIGVDRNVRRADRQTNLRFVEWAADMPPAAPEKRAKEALKNSRRALVLIDRAPTTTIETLRIVRPLAEYTMTEPRRQ